MLRKYGSVYKYTFVAVVFTIMCQTRNNTTVGFKVVESNVHSYNTILNNPLQMMLL